MSKFKNWWDKPYTRGDLVKYSVISMILTAVMYGMLMVVAQIDKWKRGMKRRKIDKVSYANNKID